MRHIFTMGHHAYCIWLDHAVLCQPYAAAGTDRKEGRGAWSRIKITLIRVAAYMMQPTTDHSEPEALT